MDAQLVTSTCLGLEFNEGEWGIRLYFELECVFITSDSKLNNFTHRSRQNFDGRLSPSSLRFPFFVYLFDPIVLLTFFSSFDNADVPVVNLEKRPNFEFLLWETLFPTTKYGEVFALNLSGGELRIHADLLMSIPSTKESP